MLEQEVRIGQVLSTPGSMNLSHWKEMLWNVGWAGPIPGRRGRAMLYWEVVAEGPRPTTTSSPPREISGFN